MEKVDIKNFTLAELEKTLRGLKEPAYRARQIFYWLYQKDADGFNAMKNLPDRLKEKMRALYYVSPVKAAKRLFSKDGSEKFLTRLKDGSLIETVHIPGRGRNTLCLSTQAGCKFGCLFCASGLGGFKRDLNISEILNQILSLGRRRKRVTNYVFMGMGEPLDNYASTTKAIRIMNTPEGMNIGARRITVSTCGICPGIERLKGFGLQINLSVSLHATNDALRDKLMPVNKVYPLEKLLKACGEYAEKTKRAITLEYILIKGVNDSFNDAEELAAIAKNLRAKINIIACSPVPALEYAPPEVAAIRAFMERLAAKNANATLRQSKGKDINAACGQLCATN